MRLARGTSRRPAREAFCDVFHHLFISFDIDFGFGGRKVRLRQLITHGVEELFVGAVFGGGQSCFDVPFVIRQ